MFTGLSVNVETAVNVGSYSWQEFVGRAARRITEPAAPGGGNSSQLDYGNNWHGTDSLQEAVDMATRGWQEGVKALAKNIDSHAPLSAEEVLPDWNLDVSGSMCNVPAFLSGEPECMWKQSECRRPERRITVIAPGQYSGSIDSQTIQKYAAALASVVGMLESLGMNPAIKMVTANATGKGGVYAVSVREFGEPLDLAHVAFAFHPAFLRRIQFAWQEITPEAIAANWGNGGYGSIGKVTDELVSKVLGDIGYTVVLPSPNDLQNHSFEEMITVMRETIDKRLKQLS